MKCCHCEKEIDVGKSPVPPKWFGKYSNADLRKVICAECIKTKDGMEKYQVKAAT